MKQMFKFMILLLVCLSSATYAEVRIVIDRGVDSARPIAILPFKWVNTNNVGVQNIEDIVAMDLRNSGKFAPLAKSRMPELPTTSSGLNPAVWNRMGISYVVMGSIQTDGDGFLVSYQLIDISGTTVNIISQNQFKVTKKWQRYAAHTISDEVFEKLLGIKGAFRTRIAYVARVNNSRFPYELKVADYDGYNQFVIHRSPEPLMSPAWSARGDKVAFVTFERGRSELVMKTLATGSLERIASYPRHNGAPSFSPDGSKLALVLSKDGSLNVYVLDLTTNSLTRVTQGHSNNTEPSWFPDGQTLAYTSDQAGRPQVYRININGGAPTRISWEGTQNQNPEVAPDGRTIVMVSTVNGKQNLVKQNLSSGSVQALTDTFLDETPSISPNGTMVIYSATQGTSKGLYLISIDGRFKARISSADNEIKFPAWSPYL